MESDAEIVRSVEEFGRFLIAPDAAEMLSPVGADETARGPGFVVVDLVGTPESDVLRWRALLEQSLPSLPCVTVAIGPGPGEAWSAEWHSW